MLKYVNLGVVFQEIPDEVTLSINISNCPCHCPHCHSKYLWEDIGEPLTPLALEKIVREYDKDITCICFMGGDAEPVYVNTLANYLHIQHPELKVAWYSGRIRISSSVCKNNFDYIKIGPYIEHLGCLKSCTTNQRLLKRISGDCFTDITERFWKK
ncbi:MAG: anaerobic ribonucleoside-triphosphate reductase activating protein [Prevotella sp.]|nr:anaerobic ribonucleoside-triphosphate reductase activating protein [Prevotella sp.]